MGANRNRLSGLDGAVAEEVRRRLAERRDLSVAGIAASLGMRRATLSVRVNGHVPFSPSLLAAVARAMGTTASEIVARAERAGDEPATGPPSSATAAAAVSRLAGRRRSHAPMERTRIDGTDGHHDPAGPDRPGADL